MENKEQITEFKNQSIDELKKIKKIINIVINFLEKNIDYINSGNFDILDQQKNLIKFLIGSRENVVSTVTRLINILLKIKMITSEEKEDKKIENESPEEIDIEILERYIKNFKNNN